MINDQQITVDFDGRKWILPELTLAKVGAFFAVNLTSNWYL